MLTSKELDDMADKIEAIGYSIFKDSGLWTDNAMKFASTAHFLRRIQTLYPEKVNDGHNEA